MWQLRQFLAKGLSLQTYQKVMEVCLMNRKNNAIVRIVKNKTRAFIALSCSKCMKNAATSNALNDAIATASHRFSVSRRSICDAPTVNPVKIRRLRRMATKTRYGLCQHRRGDRSEYVQRYR